MSRLWHRICWFFRSTEGLLIVATAWEALLIAFLAVFPGPIGLGPELTEAGRVGRIIMLYHALAIPFIAALVYLILDALPFDEKFPRIVRPTITVGYMLASAAGIGFGYFGAGWIGHGIFLVGLSLVFYAGLVLTVGLFPWRRGPEGTGFSQGRLAFWLMAVYTLISVTIGGVAGAYFGNGFTAFLAEDIVRESHTLGHGAIIAHLHIMLTLIDVALLLLVARRFGLRGRAYRVAMPLIVVGTTVVSFATWSVMVFEGAHKIINVGAAVLLPAAFIVAFYGFAGIVRERLAQQGLGRGTFGQRLRALFHDPIRFGIFFELIFVNVVVTVPGVYVAFNLDTYRQPAFLEVERTILVGHWHVLATLSAVIALFLVVDRLGVRGFMRQLVGWGVLLGSTLAFVFVQFYMFRLPGQEVGWTVPLFEAGVGIFLVVLAIFLGERVFFWDVEQ